ncbi:OmpA family protein [Azospirillum formosense]|uniref:OmpA family protein n=1 Tax=Azospirillum formosense TaxID=861533 RepID=UPI001C90D97E|nr:OmpA family protein [Azospirillum formosense]MBY3753383.1 OmpA family protein [Azospirillum formosense]
MSGSPNAPVGRPVPPRVIPAAAAVFLSLAVTACSSPGTAPPPTSAPPPQTAAANPGGLTLENAQPLPIPPRPDIFPPPAPPAPPVFRAPTLMTAPDLPQISVGPSPAQPALPEGAPPIPPSSRPAASPPPDRTQTAALPPPTPKAPSAPALPRMEPLTVLFDGTATALPDPAQARLDAIAERMSANPQLRLQIRSYASGTPETAREARQLSLARALAVRERLGTAGIASTRVDIRAMGMEAAGGAPDRLDVEFLNQ